MSADDALLSALERQLVIPVVSLEDETDAPALGEALLRGGISCIEVTLRTAAADRALRALSGDPRLLVGAGTVIGSAGVDRALAAGARFAVSPGLSPAVIGRCRDASLPVLPGATTATEVQAAVELGLRTVKFFPAASMGGPASIRALSAPFPDVRFVPTGGVSAENLTDYLVEPAVVAVGGSWMVAPPLVGRRAWDEVASRARAATEAARAVRAATVA